MVSSLLMNSKMLAAILLLTCPAAGQQSASSENPPRVRVGSELFAPRLIREVQPEYPEAARRRHIRGFVIIEIHVNREGHVTEARVVRGHPLFVDAALAAVRQWVYQPFTFDGAVVEGITAVAISFPPPGKPL
jgi:protein TonB